MNKNQAEEIINNFTGIATFNDSKFQDARDQFFKALGYIEAINDMDIQREKEL